MIEIIGAQQLRLPFTDGQNQGFIRALGVAVASDGLDFVLPYKILSKVVSPLPGSAPLLALGDAIKELVDAGTRAFVESQQGGSVLRELVAPIESFVPISPTHILAVLAGEAEKKFLPQLMGLR